MKAVVLAGGFLKVDPRLKRFCREASLVIAADSGLRHAAPLDITPDLITGDFDSVADDDLATFAHVAKEPHPADKDQLDLELALEAALARGALSVRVLGALGGRFDQTLATLLIAARLRREGTDISLHTGTT
ncbi:MAG: thiamine diphosphokinase, partial [Trueperaceae bacterium]